MTTSRTCETLLALAAALLTSCGAEPDRKNKQEQTADAVASEPSPTPSTGTLPGDESPAGGDAAAVPAPVGNVPDVPEPGNPGTPAPTPPPINPPEVTSESAFALTVYPLVRQYCQSCHAAVQTPFFAHDDPVVAHKAVLESGKVNFAAVQRSRLVVRLSQLNHNCWSQCPADGAAMEETVRAWLEQLVKAGKAPVIEPVLETAELMLSAATERDAATDTRTIALEAEAGTVTAPMVMTADPMVSGGQYVQVPTGAAINNPTQANAGFVTYQVDVKTAGSYNIWGLVNAPTAQANRFFVRVDAGAYSTWTLPVNNTMFTWNRVAVNNVPVAVNLTAGLHTLEVKRSRSATKLDIVAVTSDPAFDGSTVRLGKVKVLKFDLSDVLKQPNMFLEIEMQDYSDTAYKFRAPKILVGAGSVHIKSLRVLVNGEFDPQHATYTLIDQTVAAPGVELSPAAMIVIKDKGTAVDKISLGFDVLELK